MTSWNLEELEQLRIRGNHKVVKDIAGEFRWMHKLNDKWDVHSIKVFEEENQAYNWMYFWLDKWSKEFVDRQDREFRGRQRKLRALRKNTRKTNVQKIQQLRTLMTSWTIQEIANEMKVSKSTVDRAIKQMTF